MAFVPEFDHDIFISYARVNDEEVILGGDRVSWVTTLKEQLATRVRQTEVGKNLEVWMDRDDLGGEEGVTPALNEAVSKAAVIVVILSENYVQSEWCQREIAGFAEAAARNPRLQGRIFVVHYSDVGIERRPPTLQDLAGFPFFDEKSKAELDPRSDPYQQALLGLRNRISQKLIEMRDAGGTPEAAAPPADDQPSVFLAEAMPGTAHDRIEFASLIERLGYRVLPANLYNRDPEEFRQAAMRDAGAARLFVQWIGEFPTFRTADLPDAYEGLQLEVARAAGLEMLRGYRKDAFDVATLPDDAHRLFLQAEDVMALDPEEFKARIEARLRELALVEEHAPDEEQDADDNPIVIAAENPDTNAVHKIKARLAEKGAHWFEVVDEKEVFEELTTAYDPNGFVVVFDDRSERKQVADWMRTCAFHRRTKRPHEPACAVFLDPPEKKNELLSTPPFFATIPGNNGDAELARFLQGFPRRTPSSAVD